MSPAPSESPGPRPGAFRTSVERVSLPLVTRLSTLPRAVPFVLTLAVAVVGLFVGGVIGFVLVLVGMALPAWFLFLGWPQLAPVERLMRVAVLFCVLGLAAVTLLPS